MEDGRGKGPRRDQRWRFTQPRRVFSVYLFLLLAAWGVWLPSARSVVIVYESSSKRYVVSENKITDPYSNRRFESACESIHAEMAVLDTNAEFEKLRQGVKSKYWNTFYRIYIYLEKRSAGTSTTYHWAEEEIDKKYWWDDEPDGRGDWQTNSCKVFSSTCRPFIMTNYQSFNVKKEEFLLRDTCCTYTYFGLCVQDVNECLDPKLYTCQANSSCVNTKGNYTCQCNGGFNATAGLCKDIDECAEDTLFSCPGNSSCVNTAGSFQCSCIAGFTELGGGCVDIDECKNEALFNCTKNSSCVNLEGNYTCNCDSGYTQDGDLCIDVNECEYPDRYRCPRLSRCANKDGSWVCYCMKGTFINSKSSCEDTNECLDPELYSCPTNRHCVNVELSYTCECDDGFNEINEVCEDINECENSTLFDCPENSTCVNLEGDYRCDCDPGYTKDDDRCIDIDECENSTLFKCPEHSTCMNLEGKFYRCDCHPGYTPNGDLCIDIDECKNEALFNCTKDSTCVNLEGNYTCDCSPGYTQDDDLCIDVNECEKSTLFKCQKLSGCVNTVGSYSCLCQKGFFTNESGLCEEVDKKGFKLRTCPCTCPKAVIELSRHLPDAKNSSETIQKELEVKTTDLATAVRKKTSAADERGSSESFGVIALTMLALEFFLVSVGDLIVVILYIKEKLVCLFCQQKVGPGELTNERTTDGKNQVQVPWVDQGHPVMRARHGGGGK